MFFRAAIPCSGGYHLERGGMPLHDAGGDKLYKGGTTENQGTGKYMNLGEYFDDRVCVIWLNMTNPPWWREKVMVYYLKIILFKKNVNVK